jgi:hypothetical protein
MDVTNETNDPLARSLAIASSASRFALMFTSVAYVFGLLITNIYLGFWDVPASPLAQARYILVGSLWLFLLTFTEIAMRLCRHELIEARERYYHRRLARFAVQARAVIGSTLAVGFTLWLLTGLRNPYAWVFVIGAGAILHFTVIAIGAVAEVAVDLAVWLKTRERQFVGYAHAYLVLAQIVCCVVSLALYALLVYPHVVQSIGGGRPTRAYFVLAPESTFQSSLGARFQSDGSLGPIKVLHEDHEAFYVVVGTGLGSKTARIPKGEVRFVVMEPTFFQRRN